MIGKLTRTIVRTFAFALALCSTSGAWADVTPAAVWESDFGVQKTRGAYTLTLPADSWVDSDGNLNIASGNTSANISFTGGGSAISVLMEYENAVASSATAGMIPIIVNPSNTENQFGVKVYEAGSLGLSGSYQTGVVFPKSGTQVMTTMPSSGVLLFSMPNGSNCSVYSATTREGLTATGAGSSINGLKFTNSTLTQIGLGGPVSALNNISNFTGLKIKKVAIFKSAIFASDAAAYVFPSERSFDYSATVTSPNTTWTDISWDNGATWDDAADNTSKSVYLKFANGASVVRDGGLNAGSVYLAGAGSLNFTDTAGTGATVSSVISGTGAVVAQSGTINFTGANAYFGGLTVKSGALAKTTNSSGFGMATHTITVENGGAADIANTGASTYKFVIAGTGVNNSGALYSSKEIGGGLMQAQAITLTGDATITVGANWGIINSNYAAASLSLGSYTLTKKGSGRFWLCNTTISGTGTIKVETGFLDTIGSDYTSTGSSSKIKICSGATMFIGGDTALDGLDYTFGNLSIANLEIDAGGNVTVASGRTLTVTSSLVSNGTITDNGAITCSGTISGADQSITIGSGATFTWQNQSWSSGDYFTGNGTLELSVSSGLKEMSATSNFSGILKLTGSKTDSNYPVIGGSSGDAENIFVGMPELVLNGYMGLQNSFVGKSLSVRDFSDTSASDRIRMNKFTSSSSIKTIKTKQTKDTTVQGRFQYSSTGPTYSALTVYGDDNATEIHSLTLSGANETLGPLTVQNNAKVILATGGKWAGPTTVENGGFLEAKHTSAPLAALTLNAGATIVIPSLTTTTGTGDEAVTTKTTTPITASGAITFSGSGVVNVDLSNAAISEEDAATVIMTGASIANITSENVDEIFQETSGDYKFTIDGNSVKAQNIGTCTWTGSAWDGDPADYNEVVVNVDAGGTTLTLDRAYSFRRVTLSGSAGTLMISGAGSITTDELIIPSGVTMTATSLISTLVISGDGTLNIPLGTTYTMNGVTCSVQVTCAGKLITQGITVLSNSTSTYSGEVVVESGTTDFNSAQQGVTGKITIDSGATLRTDFDQWDHLNYEGTCEVHVYGTLNFQNVWSVGSNNTFYFYNGCTISGQGNTHVASIDWIGAKVYVKADKNEGKGTVTLPVTSRLRANTTIEVDEGMTFTMNGPLNSSSGTGFGFTKQGSGVFNFTPSSTASFTGTTTVAAGQMIMTSNPTFGTIQIDESAVFTLRSDLNGSTTYTGTGTLELENLSGNKWYLQNTAFAGKIKTKNSGGNYWIGGANANGGQAPLFSGYPELIAESGQQLLNRNFNGKTLPVRDLSGNATFYVGNVDTDADRATRTVSTKQTKNTTFGGLFKSYNDCTTSLSVYGEDSANVYALTLTGASTSAGDLTVSTYAKVVFSESGSWHNGLVTVGANGYLESTNAAAVTKLTLQDGANIVFPASSSKLSSISALTFASGTTKIHFGSGVTPTSGTKLINWSSAPVGSFVFDDGADVKQFGELYYLLQKDEDGLYIRKAVAADSIIGSPKFYASIARALEEQDTVYLISPPNETVTLNAGKTIINMFGVDVSNLTVNAPTYEYVSPLAADANGNYSLANEVNAAATYYYWKGASDSAWSTVGNWKYIDGEDVQQWATRCPTSVDTVIFNDGATVTLNDTVTVAGIEVNGDVSISATAKSLNTSGNVTTSSSGTLTLSDVCLASAAAGVTVAPAVNFTNDSEISGDYPLTINGNVTISGSFKARGGTGVERHTITGDVTINSGANFSSGGVWVFVNGDATVKGSFTSGNSKFKFCRRLTIEAGRVTANGSNVNVDSDAISVVLAGLSAEFADTRAQKIDDSKVSTTVPHGAVKKTGNIYSVSRCGTIFSVY